MNLADHPDEIVATANDHEAKALLKKLGLLERLINTVPEKCLLPNQVARLDIWRHPTHWITAFCYFGFERAEDNGFAVRCQPKSVVTLEMFKAQLQTENQQAFTCGHTQATDDLPPTGNN